ncbi:Histone deacetylase complex subunit SAP130 C-terminal domain [Trinorchestia longiramus]|nr:Histone deacetylase complex subunit SAP130 C-terminal domain [Trinorchestia longiramus]
MFVSEYEHERESLMDVVLEQYGENKWNARSVEGDFGMGYLVELDEECNMTVVDEMKYFLLHVEAILLTSCCASEMIPSISPSSSTAKSGSTIELTLTAKDSPPCSSNTSALPVFPSSESSLTLSTTGNLRTPTFGVSTTCSLTVSVAGNISSHNSTSAVKSPPTTQAISTTACGSVPGLPRSCVNPVGGTAPISSGGLSPSSTVPSNMSRLSSSGALNLTLTQSATSVASNLPASMCVPSTSSNTSNKPINKIVSSSSTAVKLTIPSSTSCSSKSISGRIVQSFCTLPSSSESSPSQPSMSHVHIPRGAAVVANMAAGSRSSQAVTASAAHRAGSLSNRGIQLGQSSWNKGSPASKLAAGTTVFTTIASSTTPKLTRFPATSLMSRPVTGNLLNVSASTSSTVANTALRITSSTPSVRSTPSTTGVLRPNSISRVANVTSLNTVEVMHSVPGSSASAVTAAPRLTVATTVKPLDGTVVTNFPVCRPTIVATPSAVSRTVLTQTRTPLGVSVRPHTNSGLRLTQATISRPAAVTSLALTCVRPAATPSTSTIATAKVRGISNSRFSLTSGNQLIPGSESSSTTNMRGQGLVSTSVGGPGSSQCYTTSTSIANAPPARPLSSPAICVPGRPVMSASRPSSTGPSTSPAPVQSPSARPGPTAATPRAAVGSEGVLTMRSCTATAETRTGRPTQQFMHISASNGQKMNSSGVGNVSVIGGSTIRCGPVNNSGSCQGSSIAVRISPSNVIAPSGGGTHFHSSATPQVGGSSVGGSVGSVSVVTARQGGRLSDHHGGPLGSASGKTFGVVSGSNSNSAAAAAAVLPPGTTITPTVLPPTSHSKHDSPAPAAVVLQRPVPGAGNSSTGTASQMHDGKPSATTVAVRSSSGATQGSGGRRPPVGTLISDSGGGGALAPSQQQQPQQAASAPAKPAASPRPTILRKRSEFDVGSSAKACRNLTGALSSSSGSSSSPPSPKRPDSRGNSGASTGSVTLSADSSPGLLIEETEVADEARMPAVTPAALPSLMEGISPRKKPRKQKLTGNELQDAPHSSDDEDSRVYKRIKREVEGEDAVDGCHSWPEQASRSRLPSLTSCARFHGLGLASGGSLKNGVSAHRQSLGPSRCPTARIAFNHRHANDSSTTSMSINALSPKAVKRARKNLGGSSGCNSDANAENNYNKDTCSGAMDKNSTPSSPESPYRNKRKHMSLLNSYSRTHLPRINHFIRYSDVEVKKEKKSTVNNLAGQKMAMKKLEGWKVIHVGGQVSDLVDVEQEVSTRLNDILDSLENKSSEPQKVLSKDVNQICELIKANVQRSKIIEDQMREAKVQMTNLFVHKDKVASILKNYTELRQRSCAGLTHLSTHAGKDNPPQLLCTASRPKINKKIQVMMLNVHYPSPVTVNIEDMITTEEFTYLGSTVRFDSGVSSDIMNRLSKARCDQTEAVPELRSFHPIVQLVMLENVRK